MFEKFFLSLIIAISKEISINSTHLKIKYFVTLPAPLPPIILTTANKRGASTRTRRYEIELFRVQNKLLCPNDLHKQK